MTNETYGSVITEQGDLGLGVTPIPIPEEDTKEPVRLKDDKEKKDK